MSDRRGILYQSDAPDTPIAPKSPDAPVSNSEIMGAHWTVDRQDIVGQDTVERKKYGQIAAEIDAHDGVSALQTILAPRHGTPDLLAGNTTFDKDAIWRDVQRIRQTNPDFLSSTPARNAREFDAWLLERSKKERAGAQDVIRRQSGIVQKALGFGTDLATGFTDPLNVATIPIGGGGKTILQTMAREALVNGLTEAAELPFTAHNRARLGETMTAGDMAADVGMAALGGAVLPGLLHVGGKAASAAGRAIADSDVGKSVGRTLAPIALRLADLPKASDADVAGAFSRAVPAELRTPEQQAALHVMERQGEIDASNPYVDTPASRDVHADRLQEALAAVHAAGDPDAVAAPVTPRSPVSQSVSRGTRAVTGAAAIDTVMARIGRVENASGGGTVRNSRSSATGKYQFTDRTWLRYYKREIGADGMSDAQILAQRGDGATQDRLMRALTSDNARFLHGIGQPETAGNLYLAHFAGQGGARRILEAEASTPIERVLSAEAIAANPFLRGRTAGDVVEWAHAKMGEARLGADRVQIAGDAGEDAVRLAQQELDSAMMETAIARAPGERAEPAIDTTIDAVPRFDEPAPRAVAAAVPREILADVPRGDAAAPIPAAREAAVVPDPAIEALADQVAQLRRDGRSLAVKQVAAALGTDERTAQVALTTAAGRPGSGLRVAASSGRVSRIPQSIAPKDVLRTLAEAGGVRDDEGHALRKYGRVTGATGKGRSGRDLGRVFVPGVGKLISSKGMSIDRAGELLYERGFFTDRPSVADVLELIDRAGNGGEKIYAPRDTPTGEAGARFTEQETERAWQALADHAEPAAIDDALVEDVAALIAQGADREEAAVRAITWRLQQTADVVHELTGDPIHDVRSANSDTQRVAGDAGGIDARDDGYEAFLRSAEASRTGAGAGQELSLDEFDAAHGGARADALEEAGLAGPALAETPGPSLDDPNGPAGKAIADSLTHDVKAAIDPNIAAKDAQRAQLKAEAPMRAGVDQDSTIGAPLFDAVDQGGFRLEEGGALRSAEDVLRELDADDAAIKAARDCL